MKIKIRAILFIGISILMIIFGMGKSENTKIKKPFIIEKWNNFYEDNNIHLYYDDCKSPILKEIKDDFLDESIVKEKDEIKKSELLLKYMGERIKYKEDIKSKSENYKVLEILKNNKKNEKKYSNEECNMIFNNCALSVGVISRVGNFVSENGSFKVCEIWSNKYKKWVMIDPCNECYVIYKNIPLSSVELIQKNIENIKVVFIKNNIKDYKNFIKSFLEYNISIDNSIYKEKNSNSYICYVKNKNKLPINIFMEYPVVFTSNKKIFLKSPKLKVSDKYVDKVSTLIFSRKNTKDNEKKVQFYGGVFKDSVMTENYYISINKSPLKKVNNYFDFTLKEGINTVKLSLNGKDVVREVSFKFKGK